MRFVLSTLTLAMFLLACVSCADQPSAPEPAAESNAWRIVAPAVPDT